ncbi:MAG: transposase [Candidatus Cloacimonetes bacterium]|nr:transposase [Candidatus Cloacimonadota bacterium]
MRTDKVTMTDYEIEDSLAKVEHFLLEFKEMVNWDKVKKYLAPLDPPRISVAGSDSYDPVKMFRVMLVQSWYDLSDPEMEFYLHTNLLFDECPFSFTIPAALTKPCKLKRLNKFKTLPRAMLEVFT